MERRFKLLRVFGIIFKILAWGALFLGLVGAVGVVVAGSNGQPQGVPPSPLAGVVVVLSAWSLIFIIFYTVSEMIKLLLAIEENSRKDKEPTVSP